MDYRQDKATGQGGFEGTTTDPLNHTPSPSEVKLNRLLRDRLAVAAIYWIQVNGIKVEAVWSNLLPGLVIAVDLIVYVGGAA